MHVTISTSASCINYIIAKIKVMNIIVCVKQVPGTSQVEVDPVTGVLKRDGVDSKLNPYDLFALEAALKIKDEFGGKITALSMGPNQAIPSLLETVYMGTDAGVLLSDRKFAGADVQATSYAISEGVKKIGDYDLIICGKQTTDGDTAQVGPEMAEKLGCELYMYDGYSHAVYYEAPDFRARVMEFLSK